jgi:predicted membrane-bound spermidine synthase
MHWRGEKHITYIYAFSTMGSVMGGLAHGLILIPLWGIRSAYICAVIFAGLALYTMYPVRRRAHQAVVPLILFAAVASINWNVAEILFPSKNILFSKDSEFGIVEVWRLSEGEALYKHLALGGKEGDFKLDGEAIDLKVNNVHQSFNLQIDRNIHEQWAITSLNIVNRPAKVLLLGLGSGVTAMAFLKSPMVERLDIVENCAPLVEAAQLFFAPESEYVEKSPKARNIIDDFRGYVRFADEKYDIIAMDHTIEDPYAIGFFTVEFFDQLKRISKPGAVVMMLGKGLSWNTTRMSFKYIYKNSN